MIGKSATEQPTKTIPSTAGDICAAIALIDQQLSKARIKMAVRRILVARRDDLAAELSALFPAVTSPRDQGK
jgi:hypothetical protein